MNGLDWSILIAYFAGLVGLSAWLGRGQVSEEDYFLAGRRLSWWSVGLSTMATQSSAISFIGIPAYGGRAGVLLPRAGARAAVTGLIAGVGLNLALFFGAPGVFWAWWNVTGCSATLAGIAALGAITPRRASGRGLWLGPREIARRERPHAIAHLSLVAWFVVILAVYRLASRVGGGP